MKSPFNWCVSLLLAIAILSSVSAHRENTKLRARVAYLTEILSESHDKATILTYGAEWDPLPMRPSPPKQPAWAGTTQNGEAMEWHSMPFIVNFTTNDAGLIYKHYHMITNQKLPEVSGFDAKSRKEWAQ